LKATICLIKVLAHLKKNKELKKGKRNLKKKSKLKKRRINCKAIPSIGMGHNRQKKGANCDEVLLRDNLVVTLLK